MKLTIAICSLPIRIDSFTSLIKNLNNQILTNGFQNTVEIISLMDCKSMSVGQKRNYLKQLASGEYLCYIDDDDRVSGDYLPSIINAMGSGADAITFRGEYRDGESVTDWMITTANGFTDTHTMLYRKPNHLSPVKRDIYLQCDFTLKNYGEDSDYSDQINKLIKTEYHIPKKLYFYDFAINKSQTHPESKTGAFNH